MCDGDKLLIVADKTLVRVAKRNMENIVPLYYNMKKAESQGLNYDTLFDGLVHAYTGGNIGLYSNNISKIHNCGELGQEQLDVIKLLCMENNFVIDYAKTLYKPTRPKQKDELIKQYTQLKLPYFFVYAKDKSAHQVNSVNESTMNMLNEIIPKPVLRINKTLNKINTRMLLSDMDFEYTCNEQKIIDRYDICNRKKNFVLRSRKYNKAYDKEYDNEAYIYQSIKQEILSMPYGREEIIDTLIKYLFDNRKSSDKKTLWECFGEDIYMNLKKNIEEHPLGKVCPICGHRFNPIKNQLCCSLKCSEINKREQNMIRKRRSRDKEVTTLK